jgi:hypothetical protein
MRQKAAFFDFEASIAHDATQELIWKLTDIASKHILWPAREPLSKLEGSKNCSLLSALPVFRAS